MKIKDLNEARVPGLDYAKLWRTKKAEKAGEMADRVVLTLEGTDSAIFTKMAKKYKRIQKLTDLIVKARESLNLTATDKIIDLFDAEDKIFTRVIETVSATFTLAKEVEEKEEKYDWEKATTTDWQKVATEISTMLDKDLIPAYEYLVMLYTKVKEPPTVDPDKKKDEPNRKPALRVNIKEQEKMLLETDKIAALINKFSNVIDRWAPQYDQKLSNIRRQLT